MISTGPSRGLMREALGRHLKQGDGHQEARAQSDEIAQVALDALGAHQHQSAGHIGQGGNGAEDEGELQHLSQPLCRMCMTSPSCTMYSLPSRRRVPLDRAAASEPASSSVSQRMVSARMK